MSACSPIPGVWQHGDFENATFIGDGEIKLNGASLANADLSGSNFTANGGF